MITVYVLGQRFIPDSKAQLHLKLPVVSWVMSREPTLDARGGPHRLPGGERVVGVSLVRRRGGSVVRHHPWGVTERSGGPSGVSEALRRRCYGDERRQIRKFGCFRPESVNESFSQLFAKDSETDRVAPLFLCGWGHSMVLLTKLLPRIRPPSSHPRHTLLDPKGPRPTPRPFHLRAATPEER